MIVCLIATDHAEFFRKLNLAVCEIALGSKIAQYADVHSALLEFRMESAAPGLVLLQIDGEGYENIAAIKAIKMQAYRFPIIAFGEKFSEAKLLSIIRRGVHGCLSSSASVAEIASAIRHAQKGSCFLSPGLAGHFFRIAGSPLFGAPDLPGKLTQREIEILRILARGYKYEDVAVILGISLSTVQTHVRSIYSKLGVRSLVQAVDVARRDHLV